MSAGTTTFYVMPFFGRRVCSQSPVVWFEVFGEVFIEGGHECPTGVLWPDVIKVFKCHRSFVVSQEIPGNQRKEKKMLIPYNYVILSKLCKSYNLRRIVKTFVE